MSRPLHMVLPLAGTAYALAGAAAGVGRWDGEWLELLTLGLAIVTGLWAAAAAGCASTTRLRRPLLAISVLAPITLVPEAFQPVQELTTLRLLTAATVFDALLTATNHENDPRRLRRWLWPALIYGGSLTLAFYRAPFDLVSVGWGILCLTIVAATSIERLLRPGDLEQECSALHTLWTLIVAAAAATIIVVLTQGRQDITWAASVAVVAHGLHRLAAQLGRADTSFSARSELAPLLVAGLLALNGFILLVNVARPGPLAAAATVIVAVLLARPMTSLARQLLDSLHRSSSIFDDAIQQVLQGVHEAETVEDLVVGLRPLAAALPKGGLALVCFDEDYTMILVGDEVEKRRPGPGEVLREQLASPLRERPLIARHVIDRSVREASLRPTAELARELDSDLIIPISGGLDRTLIGALFVGHPARGGRLRGRRAALILDLARALGPLIASMTTLERAGRRIAELETQRVAAEDRIEHLEYRLQRVSEEVRLLRADRAGTSPSEVVGRSEAMRSLLTEIERAAPMRSSLLIRGEAGTGRTLVARTLHQRSPQRAGPFVQLHCAATPQSSHLEVLVGRADNGMVRPGLIELADQGTLLLEEVGALSLDAQAELIKLMASSEVSRGQNGDSGPVSRIVDVRVVGTTGRSTERALASDTLLPELHDRLKTLELSVPPLRERKSDIRELASFFLDRASRRHGLSVEDFRAEALEALERYDWPGNVRQLRAVIEHAALLSQERHNRARGGPRRIFRGSPRVSVEDLPPLAGIPETVVRSERADSDEAGSSGSEVGRHVLDGTFEEIEREALLRALERAEGNKAEAARLLGLKRTTFNSRLLKHLIDED